VQQLRGRSAGSRGAVGGTWTFYVESGVSRFLPLPGAFGSLRLRETAQVQMIGAQQIVALRADPLTMTAFQLEEVVPSGVLRDEGFSELLAAWHDGAASVRADRDYEPRILLRPPEGAVNEVALRRMVNEITQGQAMGATEFVERATAWLRAKHAYALSSRIPNGAGDAIVKWLDSDESGFCEYFAAGVVVLSRAAGHPARVVAGFHGGMLNAFENYYMVRNSDAHAWAEVFDGNGQWLRVDATPGALSASDPSVAAMAQRVNDRSWAARFDSLRVLWYRRVVNFDSRAQVEMLQQVKSFTTDAGAVLRAKFDAFSLRLKTWIGKPWDGKRVARVAGLLVIVTLWSWSLVRVARALKARWGRGTQRTKFDPVRREAGRWLGRLEEVDRTPERARVVAELQRLRYGARETWAEPRAVFGRAKRAKKAAR
jgi:transglutaminase-like putative cysteine protease